MTFGRALQAVRERRRDADGEPVWSRGMAARKLGIDRGWYWRIEHDQEAPLHCDQITRLCKARGLSEEAPRLCAFALARVMERQGYQVDDGALARIEEMVRGMRFKAKEGEG